MNSPTKDSSDPELEKRVGISMGLLYREATDQWLMDITPQGDNSKWHMHDMTTEVRNTTTLITQEAYRLASAVIGENGFTTGSPNVFRGDGKSHYDISIENQLKNRQRQALKDLVGGGHED